jgi:hypothetical protein
MARFRSTLSGADLYSGGSHLGECAHEFQINSVDYNYSSSSLVGY